MTLRILSVGYSLAAVTPDSLGGAEQVLSSLDRAIVDAGHASAVVAPKGSVCLGQLYPTPVVSGDITASVRQQVQRAVRQTIARAVTEFRPDLIHCHGVDFHAVLPPTPGAVLVTLHLPLDWYPPEALRQSRPLTWFNPVSADQTRRAPHGIDLLPAIENGVDVAQFSARFRKRNLALAMGRICPEKGFHHALDAAAASNIPLFLAGAVYPYPEHIAYFRNEIAPRLSARRRWLGPVTGRRKRRLLASARCLLIPSLVPETSSLVAREALAAGTPVIAFAAGALCDALDHGRTGFLVDDADAMAKAIDRVDAIDPELCRSVARERFSIEPMIERYLRLYARIAEIATSINRRELPARGFA